MASRRLAFYNSLSLFFVFADFWVQQEPEGSTSANRPGSLANKPQVQAGVFEFFGGSPAYKQRRKQRSPVQSCSDDADVLNGRQLSQLICSTHYEVENGRDESIESSYDDSMISPIGKTGTRKRYRACVNCRRSKIKCDGADRCSDCVRRADSE
jgi:hypothetical protein